MIATLVKLGDRQGIDFRDEGPSAAYRPFGYICFGGSASQGTIYSEWLPITVDRQVYPVPLSLRAAQEINAYFHVELNNEIEFSVVDKPWSKPTPAKTQKVKGPKD